MPAVLLTLLLLAVIGLGGFAGWAVLRRTPPANHPSSAEAERGSAAELEDDVIAAPPQVRGDDLRDWLCHYTHGQRTWPELVSTFYTRAAENPQIAQYFADVDMERLQQHFTKTLLILTRDGLRESTLNRMTEVHQRVRNTDGEPINMEVYDETIRLLVSILEEWGVPTAAVRELARVISPLRAAIVTA